jgi:4-aminobutyrate aminotransferase / (S)-3-amino-2-methylpropionate transaminase / 5-aminovalerate transaminase
MAREKGAFLLDRLGLAFRAEICAEDGLIADRSAVGPIVRQALKGKIAIGGADFGLVLNVGRFYKNVLTLAPS